MKILRENLRKGMNVVDESVPNLTVPECRLVGEYVADFKDGEDPVEAARCADNYAMVMMIMSRIRRKTDNKYGSRTNSLI